MSIHWSLTDKKVVGIDEVGRGCLAGPLVAAAVFFDPGSEVIEGVTDSKLISPKTRERLSARIKRVSRVSYGVVEAIEIDEMGITKAMHTAWLNAYKGLNESDTWVLLDGPWIAPALFAHTDASTAIVKGDAVSYHIAAASIVAKVYRDALMLTLDKEDREYGWRSNKGYGTARHIEAIRRLSLSRQHRQTFCSKIVVALE